MESPRLAPRALALMGIAILGILLSPALARSAAERRVATGPIISANPQKTVVIGRYTRIGNMGLGMTNLGWYGNLLNPTVNWPSCEYPLNSNVEHMFLGGLWVGGVSSEGETLVSAGAEDTGSSATSPKQEYGPRNEDKMVLLSSNPLSPNFTTAALADEHFEFSYDDFNGAGGGSVDDPHIPLGVRVNVKALAYAPPYADDFVILSFDVENISGREITDIYIGWYNELTVGNTTVTIPGGQPSWNFYDDINGFLGPGKILEDPDIRMMYCYDQDGEDGKARSWVGVRLLGTDIPTDTFSYRQWRFGTMPRFDSDKYAFMSSGRIDVGISEEGTNYGAVGNWVSMFAAGPWPVLFPDETANFTMAIVAGQDSTALVRNSQIAQATYNEGFQLPSGPPGPRLEIGTRDNAVVLRWDPGTEPGPDEPYDPVTASPEYHRSDFTNEYDFQGYRIYRIQSDAIEGDPFDQASVLAEFDRVEWPDGTPDPVGFNVGLPPLNERGQREFVDRGVLNGFNYFYAVTSFASRNPRLGLPELESGFNENAAQIVPGSEPGGESGPPVGVYPNPYRAYGAFDQRLPGGEPAELGRNVYFTNVPANARIRVFNLSGTLIDGLEHHDASTGQVAWDMLSEHTRALSPGLYIYVVEDLDTGRTQRGKLVILK